MLVPARANMSRTCANFEPGGAGEGDRLEREVSMKCERDGEKLKDADGISIEQPPVVTATSGCTRGDGSGSGGGGGKCDVCL